MSYEKEWKRLVKDYPALEKADKDQDKTAFERWVENMGYNTFIAINGVKKDEEKD